MRKLNKYKLFGNMNYRDIKGLWQLCIIVDNHFGYVGITDEQYHELKALEEQVYSKPIKKLIPNPSFKNRDQQIAILRENRINNIYVLIEYNQKYRHNNGHEVIGFSLEKEGLSCDG